MYNIHKLAGACRRGDDVTVQACLARGVNVNSRDYHGHTPLIAAVRHNQLEIVRILLARDDLDMSFTDRYDSELHWACEKGFADCVALLGKDRRMTKQVINMRNGYGCTALMEAVKHHHLSCVEEVAKLDGVDWEAKNEKGEGLEDMARAKNILQYLEKRKLRSTIVSPVKTRSERLKEIAGNIQALDENLEVENKVLISNQAKEKEELDQKQEKDRTVFAEKQTKELEEFSKNHVKEKNDMDEKHKIEASELNEDYNLNINCLEEDIRTLFTASKPATPLTPECPVCLELMPPPTQIYTCPNGHLECGPCKEKVTKCSICKEPVMGRATAMEQMLRTMYNRE